MFNTFPRWYRVSVSLCVLMLPSKGRFSSLFVLFLFIYLILSSIFLFTWIVFASLLFSLIVFPLTISLYLLLHFPFFISAAFFLTFVFDIFFSYAIISYFTFSPRLLYGLLLRFLPICFLFIILVSI